MPKSTSHGKPFVGLIADESRALRRWAKAVVTGEELVECTR